MMKHDDHSWENEAVGVDVEAEKLTRRDFLAFSGTGLFLFFSVGPLEAVQEPSRLPGRPGYPSDFDAYLRIAPDAA
jgi:hypothetical protein